MELEVPDKAVRTPSLISKEQQKPVSEQEKPQKPE